MARPWQYASPDTRLRHIQYAREKEEERAAKLDEQDNQRLLNIQGQMETEQARGADLDRRDSVQEEMRFEQARGAELDRRDKERPPVSEWMPQRDEAAALGPLTERPAYQAGMQQFREVEQRQQPPNLPRRVYPDGDRGPMITPELQAAEVSLAGDEPTWALDRPSGIATHLFYGKVRSLIESGLSPDKAMEQAKADPILSPEQREEVAALYYKSGQAERQAAPDEFYFQEDVAKQYAGITTGEESIGAGFFKPMLPEQVLEAVGSVPYAGSSLRREAEFLSSPMGMLTLAAFPQFMALGGVGGIAAGTAANVAGAPPGVELGAQVAGNVLTPGAGLVPARAVTRPASTGLRGAKALTEEGIQRARLAPEAGGRVPGVGPEDVARGTPSASVLGKLRAAGRQAPENWAENIRLAREEFGKRATRATELRDKLMSEGMSEQEAILQSTAELRGEHPFKAATGLDLEPAEEAWFWDQILQNAQYAEGVNVADYMQKMQGALAAGTAPKDFPPFIWRTLEKTFGKDFTNQLKPVVQQRVRAMGQVADEAAMAKVPEGVTPGPPVSTSKGAQQAVFHPEFPAPGTTLSEVAIPERAGILDFLSDTLGILKPLMSSGDISWFRQIGKTIGRHPTLAWRSFIKGTKALVSERLAVETMDALKAEGTAAAGYRQVVKGPAGTREIGLGRLLEDRYMAVPGTPGFAESSILRRPEFYMSRQAARWFGIKQSGRAFATGWNTNYQGMARYWLPKLTKMNGGELTQKQVDAALNLAERLTGVGKLGSDQSWVVKALKVLGFAPGYRVSGPEALVTLLSPTTDPLIRRMAFENLATWATLGGSIMSAAKYGAGASVITTLGASQFGRIKFPGSDTYYNIWGTDGVLARAVLQAIVQQRVDVKGSVTRLGGGDKTLKGFGEAFKDSFLQYLRSGEAPAWGLLSDLTTGETYIGEKLHWDPESAWKVVRDRLPMFGQDMIDVTQTDGPIQALLSFIPGATGTAGITSYEPIRETARAMPKYLTSDEAVVEDVLGIDVPRPLSLTANEERALLTFLREDVHDWVEEREDKRGPMPSEISMEQVIQKVGEEKGLGRREIWGTIFLHKAKSNPDAMNPEWMRFLLENRERLEDYYEETYEADYMQAAQQWAQEQGLVPAR